MSDGVFPELSVRSRSFACTTRQVDERDGRRAMCDGGMCDVCDMRCAALLAVES
jgi:hypothetical protein